MSAKEFYEYMKSIGLENIEVRVQYRDDGGDYFGYDDLGSEEDWGIHINKKRDAVYV